LRVPGSAECASAAKAGADSITARNKLVNEVILDSFI
jgi:hypothetical protein